MPRRAPRQRAERVREREHARLDERREHDRERGLDAEHAGRRFLERHAFVSGACGAWSVAIASIVPSASAARERVDVGLLAQRRVHLEHRIEAGARARR